MRSSLFRNICGKVDYNIYDDAQKTFFLVCFFTTFVNDFLLKQQPFVFNSVDVLIGTILSSDVLLSLSNGKAYTGDVMKIRELYGEFIKNYNKLNRVFDLSDPVQIYVMFNYLLYEGFLSNNKCFEFSDKKVKDLNEISGANIICGRGVCRHISAMLVDILNDYGIESGVLGVYLRNYDFNVKYLDEQKYTKEELFEWVHTYITDEEYMKTLFNLIDVLVDKQGKNLEFSLKVMDDKNFLFRFFANHAITYAFKDDKSYFLDPTQNRIYRMYDSNRLCDRSGDAIIKLMELSIYNDFKRFLDMRKRVLAHYPSISKDDENRMVSKTMDICYRNNDIFERFYNENSELYSDISDKMLKIRRSIVIR